MLYFYDCEFLEDGYTIELVSIGIAAEDGRNYYAVNRNVRWERVARPEFAWVRENVWPHLPVSHTGSLSINRNHQDSKDKDVIAKEVQEFLLHESTPDGQVPRIELWGEYPAYDHVVLCQLWGRMIELPSGIPMRTNCLVQLAESMGVSEKQLPQQNPDTQHHAMHDALHNLEVYKALRPARYFLDGSRSQVSGIV